MSHDYYNELWLVTRKDMEKLLEFDKQLQTGKPLTKRSDIVYESIVMYLKYKNLVKRLAICYNQMVQTQKRELIKRVLNCAIGRLLEFKHNIDKFDCTYYQWPDDLLQRFGYTYDDLDVPTPEFDRERVEERRKFIDRIIEGEVEKPRERSLSEIMQEKMSELNITPSKMFLRRKKTRPVDPSRFMLIETPAQKAAREAREAKEKKEKELHDAVVLIQSYERARAGRCVGTKVRFLREFREKMEKDEISPPKRLDKKTYVNSALIIQRAWKRYKAKKTRERRIRREEDVLGMLVPSWRSRELYKKDEENYNRRLKIMPKHQMEFNRTTENERTRLLQIKGPGLIEDITDEIQEWFVVWYDKVGHFDAYPAAEIGGSVLIATGQTMDPEEYLVYKMQQASKKKDKSNNKTAKEKKPKPTAWTMKETEAYTCMEECNREFIEDWKFRDESMNPLQESYKDLITDKLCHQLQLETRQIVDEMMRIELEKLNYALLQDHAKDKPRFTIPKMGIGLPKVKKPRKKREKKDRLADIPIENLFRELVQANIIRNYTVRSLKDWFGDLSYMNAEIAKEYGECIPHLGEIKQLVMDYCVLPLSSKEAHQIAPIVRSVCICGLPRYGKNFLADAICSEVGATLFDMTPSVLVNKYVGRKEQNRLMSIIEKLSRFYAPSIIFIDGGEKPWIKSIPEEERRTQPRRFAAHHARLVKKIKRGDQIMFLTISSEPYNAKAKFKNVHQIFIIIPMTDYNSLYLFYKDVLMSYHGVDRQIDVSCLAKMSVGVPLQFIQESIEKVLNLRRRVQLKTKPLTQQEIMEEIFKYEPLPDKTIEKFRNFTNTTKIGKRRKRIVAQELAERAKEAAMKKLLAKQK